MIHVRFNDSGLSVYEQSYLIRLKDRCLRPGSGTFKEKILFAVFLATIKILNENLVHGQISSDNGISYGHVTCHLTLLQMGLPENVK